MKNRKRKELEKLHKRHGGFCVYCGILTKLDCEPGERLIKATRDHIIPKWAGGPKGGRNKVLACEKCNRLKGPVDPRAITYAWLENDPDACLAFYGRLKLHFEAMQEQKADTSTTRKLPHRGVIAAFATKAAFYTVWRYLT